MITLTLILFVASAPIPEDSVYSNKHVVGHLVVMPGKWENPPALDTNVFIFDTNRGVVTLNFVRNDTNLWYPISDNQYESTRYISVRKAMILCLFSFAFGLLLMWVNTRRK